MADRQRSKDGRKETDRFTKTGEAPDQQGRGGGNLARDIGTEDQLKRATTNPAGKTRVTKDDEEA